MTVRVVPVVVPPFDGVGFEALKVDEIVDIVSGSAEAFLATVGGDRDAATVRDVLRAIVLGAVVGARSAGLAVEDAERAALDGVRLGKEAVRLSSPRKEGAA